MSKIAKRDVCKLVCQRFVGEVQKVAHAFLKQNRFNDPDSEASTKAMGMLLEQNKQG